MTAQRAIKQVVVNALLAEFKRLKAAEEKLLSGGHLHWTDQLQTPSERALLIDEVGTKLRENSEAREWIERIASDDAPPSGVVNAQNISRQCL